MDGSPGLGALGRRDAGKALRVVGKFFDSVRR